MDAFQEEQRVGLECLEAVTALLRRSRMAHPTAGLMEAADYSWWWRMQRPTDTFEQLFWFDADGRPEAAMIATQWGDGVGLDPMVMPGAAPEWVAHVVNRGLAHIDEAGLKRPEVMVDSADEVLRHPQLASAGSAGRGDECVHDD